MKDTIRWLIEPAPLVMKVRAGKMSAEKVYRIKDIRPLHEMAGIVVRDRRDIRAAMWKSQAGG